MHRWSTFAGTSVLAVSVLAAAGVGNAVIASPTQRPIPGVALGYQVWGVTGDAANDVWAFTYPGSTVRHWDGSAWQPATVPVPCNGASSGGDIRGMAAASPTDVWAVGSCFDSVKHGLTRVEHWDGTRFRRVRSPNPHPNEYLDAVSVLSATDVWAGGSNADIGSALVMHYDGTRWHVNSPPHVAEASAIRAFSDTDVWVTSRNQIAHWNGTRWNVGNYGLEYFTGLSGSSPDDVWAVGRVNQTSRVGRYDTLAEHWDGSTWTRATLPPVPGLSNYFDAVSDLAADDVWAVGTSTKGGEATEFVEHWDGVAWSVVKSYRGDDMADGYGMRGVAAISPDDVWAVGDIVASPTVHWDGSTWSRVGWTAP